MVTIVVKLLTSLVTWSLRWVFAACCGHAPGVLSAPPPTKTRRASQFYQPSNCDARVKEVLQSQSFQSDTA